MRDRRLRRAVLLGVCAGMSGIAATVALAVSLGQPDRPALPLAPLATLGHLSPASDPGPLGPENAPVPTAPSLAPTRRLHVGEQIDGITCETGEQVAFHVHAHLQIVVRGLPRRVPAGIGIAPPLDLQQTPAGPFVGGACFMWLHTHAADGIVHVESPTEQTYTLGELFDLWGQPLSRNRVGPARGAVTALFDGRVFTGNPRRIPLLAHAQIELEIGRPLLAPGQIGFPSGL